MRNKDIIIVSLQSWDSKIGSNCINIAKEFSKTNRVLYVNRAYDRNTIFKSLFNFFLFRGNQSSLFKTFSLTSAAKNLWVLDTGIVLESINWMSNPFFDFFNKLNGKKIAESIKMAMNQIGFSDTVLFVDNDFIRAQYLPDLLDVNCFIYYIRDHLIAQPYFKKHGARLEKGISVRADYVVTNSSYLANYAADFNAKSYDIGQGCDFAFFNPSNVYEKPDELKKLTGPIIGYVGALVNFRLDVKLLETLASKRKDWNWVFVGPEDDEFKVSTLHNFSNVHFLGRKNVHELASYVSGFDVCINPQLVNDSTVGNYPRKLDEYLAMGKPVVATYTEFMKSFLPWVHLCKDHEEYELAIEGAILEEGAIQLKQQRKDFALTHTWENSVGKIYDSYKKVMNDYE